MASQSAISACIGGNPAKRPFVYGGEGGETGHLRHAQYASNASAPAAPAHGDP